MFYRFLLFLALTIAAILLLLKILLLPKWIDWSEPIVQFAFTLVLGGCFALSQNALAYNNRRIAKERKGDLDGALADYSRESGPLSSGMAKRFHVLTSYRRLHGGGKTS
jgi:hypothetical protein